MGKRTLVSFDWASKKLLRQKANFSILEGFLSELLKDDIRIKNMLESEGNKENESDKHNQVDMLCENKKGELIIIEIQFYEESDYFQRILYGISKVITEYMTVGNPYDQVKKVYSINILYFDLGLGDDYLYKGIMNFNGINNGELLELGEFQKQKFGKKYPSEIFPEIILIKVNNFNKLALEPLDEWIYFLKYTELPDSYSAKGLNNVDKQLKYDNMDTSAKLEFDQYIKDVRISKDVIETAIQKGKNNGKIEEKIEVVLSCFDDKLPIPQIARIVRLTEVEIIKILKDHGKM